MTESIRPSFDAFASGYERGRGQALWMRLAADLETPVSLMLKLAKAGEDSFLLESVTGASARGRYSIIGWKPDLIWRATVDPDGAPTKKTRKQSRPDAPLRGVAEINRRALWSRDAFEPDRGRGALESLRAVLAESAFDPPDDLPSAAAGLYGYLGYEMIRLVERLPASNPDPLGLPDALLLRPSMVAVHDNAFDAVYLVTPVRPDPDVSARAAYARAAERLSDAARDLERPAPTAGAIAWDDPFEVSPTSNTSKAQYLKMVERAKRYIRAGDVFQVVPSQRWSMELPTQAFSLYRALRRTNPSPYMVYFNFGFGPDAFQIAGASPEIAVRVDRAPGDAADAPRRVTIRPIAGTRPRGDDPAGDVALEKELLEDPKEIAEHLMLLDLGRNDVGRVSEIGSVAPTEQFAVERYSHVMHIVSNVEGRLRPGVDAIDALLSGIPAGTVSGAPKIRAMEIIDELEREKRGVYAGAVGYFSANGDMDNCIALRTAVVKGGRAYVQAGGGVVADSEPEAEFDETVNKAKALFRAAEEAGRFTRRDNR